MALPRAEKLPGFRAVARRNRGGALLLHRRAFAASRCTRASPRCVTSLTAASVTAVSVLGRPARFLMRKGAAPCTFLAAPSGAFLRVRSSSPPQR